MGGHRPSAAEVAGEDTVGSEPMGIPTGHSKLTGSIWGPRLLGLEG